MRWPRPLGSPRARARCSRCLPRDARWGVIRERLVISLNTARFHTKNIYAKLGVHSQQELIDVVEASGSASTS
ncbi:LuxR C-terminal-related transcriptional regulator [Adlercreutzia caecimuris]|nr:LuxR C-terminal-related transcriptional regulator [Adlercreutzia caecimuris]MCR2037719.1 LuxR C-terminal-related transcriptional regulator [Adlercreutzia caecimuris]